MSVLLAGFLMKKVEAGPDGKVSYETVCTARLRS